jgi:hypothetical protein
MATNALEMSMAHIADLRAGLGSMNPTTTRVRIGKRAVVQECSGKTHVGSYFWARHQ